MDDRAVLDGPKVSALLAGQRANGGFGGHTYTKWGGAHWRLVSLVELGVPAGEPPPAPAGRSGPPAAPPSCSWSTGCSARCEAAR
jgi:hypothetical protein